MSVIINVKDNRWEKYKIDFEKIESVMNTEKPEISITLTDDKEIKILNKKYRKKNSPTNVLSFETEDKELLGDIFISFDTAMKESGEKNFVNHATHLIVHGILHLQGHDHIKDSDATAMERREIKILKKMKIKNPYADGSSIMRLLKIPGLFVLGMIASFGFAPYYLWPLTVISIATAYYFSRGLKTGFWWGAGYGAMSFSWALESIFANDEIAAALWWFYPIGMAGMAIGSGLFFCLPFYLTELTKSTGAKRTLYFALTWAFTLWLREWFLTGFPWNPLANITLPSVQISGLMAYVGALGLTFVLAGCIGSVPEFLRTRAKWQFLFFAPLLVAFLLPRHDTGMSDLYVRIVQPAFDMNQKFDSDSFSYNYRKLIELSKTKSDNPLDLIIWPETTYPAVVKYYTTMPALGTTLVAGAVMWNGKTYNAMVMADGDGKLTDWYWKSHLVPFGEYRPFGDIIPTPGQLDAGAGPYVMRLKNGVGFAPAICYEVVFSDSLIEQGQNPDFILNITNDAWFGTSKGPYQHLDMARRQAIETGLAIVRANYGGISAIIDSNGRVLDSLPLGEQGVLDGYVPKSRTTLYRQIGLNGTMAIIILVSGFIIILSGRRKKTN